MGLRGERSGEAREAAPGWLWATASQIFRQVKNKTVPEHQIVETLIEEAMRWPGSSGRWHAIRAPKSPSADRSQTSR